MKSFHIRATDNRNDPIVGSADAVMPEIYFNILRLKRDETWSATLHGYEAAAVVMSGTCDITAGDVAFPGIGTRRSIWDGPADSVYIPAGSPMTIVARTDGAEVAIAGGLCDRSFEPFRIRPEETDRVEVGSSDTKSRRDIVHVLGQRQAGRTGNLLVSELYCEEGCWSGYPPHKHDAQTENESSHAEL
ncbi:MAG: 5-deoxy-glucuronate isomerase, partial [Beijerinckiaceae bacterium]